MRVRPTDFVDVLRIDPEVFHDPRGFILETYQEQRYAQAGIDQRFVQDNHSRSRAGTLRGLHYQIERPQGKLVYVVVGEIYDVAVDLRRSSTAFGRWVGVRISAETGSQMWIPPGFAHGFYVLSDWADVIYKVTDFYAPEHERTLIWNDPKVGIDWPLLDGKLPALSSKDSQGKRLDELEVFE